MMDPLECRRLFHYVFVENSVLIFPGYDNYNDVLNVTVVGTNYRTTANDGFTKDTPIAGIKGIEVNGGSGDDQIIIGPGIKVPATLIGGDGNDTISGGAENDVIYGDLGDGTGKSGDDVCMGNGGRDLLYGGDGNDTLSGGTKNDTLIGELGSDSLVGGPGLLDEVSYAEKTAPVSITLDDLPDDGTAGEHDTITDTCEVFIGGSGNDFIRGSGKANIISGGDGNDTLIGGSGNDTIYGGNGNDLLEGQAGNDLLISNGDNAIDTLSGGSGTDQAQADPIDIVSGVP